MNRLVEKLVRFGLAPKEAKVSLAALELGEANIQRIDDKASVKRTTAYDVIDSLIERGYMGATSAGKRKRYFVKDPRHLEEKLDERRTVIRSILPELLSLAHFIDKKPRIRFYEGEEGIKEVYLDTFQYPKQPIFAWVAENIWNTLDRDFIDHYLENRVKKGIPAYVIAPDTKILRAYQAQDSKFLRKTLLEMTPSFSIAVEIDLYGDQTIGIMAFEEKIGLIIESKKIWITLKAIFDRHWASLGGEEFNSE